MKMNCKNLFSFFIPLIIVSVLLSPIMVSAQRKTIEETKQTICERFISWSAKVLQRITDAETKIDAKRQELKNKLNERWIERSDKIAETRAEWNANREEHFKKLEERSQTDAQKQAVLTFRQAVTSAIEARKKAIDEARETFKKGVENAVSARKTAVDATKLVFKNTVTAAVDEAKAACSANTDIKTIRENLQKKLKAAREKFAADRQTIEKMKDGAQTLITARRNAVEKAISDFKNAMQTAKNTLKPFFGEQVGEQGQ